MKTSNESDLLARLRHLVAKGVGMTGKRSEDRPWLAEAFLSKEDQEGLRRRGKQSIAYARAYFRAFGLGKLDDGIQSDGKPN